MENETVNTKNTNSLLEVDNSSYLYTIVDKALNERTNIFDAKNDKIAIRHFIGLVGNVQDFCKKDFELIRIADLDKHMCIVDCEPYIVCDGNTCESLYNIIEFNED